MQTAALAIATFSAAAAAAGQVHVVGDCGMDFYLWTASNDKAPEGQGKLPGPDEEPMPVDIEEEGVHEIKITSTNDLTVPGPQLSVVYSLVDGKLNYDLYTVFGSPSLPATLSTDTEEGEEEGDCSPIELTEDAELVTTGKACVEDASLTLSLCDVDKPEEETPEQE